MTFCIIFEELLSDIDTKMSLEDSTLQSKETLVLVATVLIFLVDTPPKRPGQIISKVSNKTEWNTKDVELPKTHHDGKTWSNYKIFPGLYGSFCYSI